MKIFYNSLILSLIFCFSCHAQKDLRDLHIVFVTGDEEYRSEESMPMLARILERELNCRVSVCYALGEDGYVDPNNNKSITGLEALKDADLMVIYTRWRALPKEQAKMITDYVESGRPVVGFRTSTHTFLYKDDETMFHLNDEWPTKVFGQKWIDHHGHYDDGERFLTEVTKVTNQKSHPILNGVEPFNAYSWLYHVDGGDYELYGDSEPLLLGKSLKSKHAEKGTTYKFPLVNPVSWTKSYTTDSGKRSRVFFTTLGHPYDFKIESMRRLSFNGILWALGQEELLEKNTLNVDYVGTYEPNNSGFGNEFKPELKPELLPKPVK